MMHKFLLVFFVVFGCAQKVNVPIDLIRGATKDKYEDANGVILFDSTLVEVKSGGKAVWREHKLLKILSSYGRKKFGEETFHYYTKEGTLMVNVARVITPEGKVISVPEENIKDVPFVPMGDMGGKMFLPDVRMVKVIFPKIEVGSSIEYIVTTDLSEPPMANRFADIVEFEGEEPILEKVYILEFSKDMSMDYLVKNGNVSFSKGEIGDKLIYRWEAKDVAGIVREPLMPSLMEVATVLIVSNIHHWEEISKWYYEISEPSFKVDDAIKNKVKELTESGPGKSSPSKNQAHTETEDEKIRAIFDFISMEVRYLRTEAISKGKGYGPDPVSLTFSRKWGVCRDKAALCVAMLKEIGVQAYIVLINVSYHTDREIPNPYFEHAIVGIKRTDGTYYYLDPTVEYTRDYFPAHEQNRELLVCTEEGEDLRFVSYKEPGRNWILIQNTGNISENGDLEATLTMRGEGMMDMQLRSFRYIPPDKQEQMFEEMIKGFSPDASLDRLEVGDPSDLSKPFTIGINYRAPEYAIKIRNELHLTSTGSSALAMGGGVSRGGGSPWGLEQRKYPLYFWFPMITKAVSEFTLPQGYRVKVLPVDFKFEHRLFSATASKTESDGKLLISSTFFIKEPLIPAEEYKELKSVVEDLEKYEKKEVVLVKSK